jgi:signal transduction histidine kinase
MAILADWQQAVRQLPAARDLAQPALIDHVPVLLDRIADMVDQIAAGDPPELPTEAAERHAFTRADEGFDLPEVVLEYAVLRDCLLRRWAEQDFPPEERGSGLVLSRAIDHAVVAAVDRFTHARERTLQALDRISTAGLESRSLDELLQKLLQALVQLTAAVDTAVILLREGDVLRVRAAVGIDGARGAVVPMGTGFAGRIAAERKPLSLPDGAIEHAGIGDVLLKTGIRVLYGVPILDDDDVLGVAHIGSRSANDFSDQDKRLLIAMAHRASAALTQHMLRESLEQRSRQQAAVTELGMRALTTTDLQAFLDDAVATVSRTLGTEYSKILELLPEGGQLLLRSGVGWKPGLVGSTTVGADRESHAGYTLHSTEPVVIQNLAQDTRFGSHQLLTEHGVVSGMSVVVPGPGGEKPYGVLGTHTRSHRLFSREDVAFLRSVASILAGVLTRIRADARLSGMYEEARAAVRMREEVLAVVSHDLKSPLQAIQLAASRLLQQTSRQPANRKYAETVQRAASRMERLIGDLLDMASLQAGRLALDRRPEQLCEIVGECLDQHEPVAKARGVTLERDLQSTSTVVVDRNRILQVLANLLDNAIKFSGPAGVVTVRLSDTQDSAEVAVSDTGPGIPGSELPHIFEPYWSSDRNPQKGTGLGLYISKGMTEAHGGRLWAESRHGTGATFFITLPRVEEH